MEKINLMCNIRIAASTLKESKLKDLERLDDVFSEIRKATSLTTNEEVMILVSIMDRQCSDFSTDMPDMARYFDCTSLDIMDFAPSIKSLLKNGYIEVQDEMETNIVKMEFRLPQNVFTNIIENKELLPEKRKENSFDQFDFCLTIDKYITERKQERIKTTILFDKVLELEERCKDLEYVSDIRAMLSDIKTRTLFYEFCNDFQSNLKGEESDIDRTLQDIYDRKMDILEVKCQFMENTHELQKEDLVEFSDPKISLSDKGIELLFRDKASLYLKCKSDLDRFSFVKEVDRMVRDLPRDFSIGD
ncbi:MAG: hypothetical protein LUD48_05555, partial [Prevotella sp.]|nr:hypothetical protein [Prevotella sp.]